MCPNLCPPQALTHSFLPTLTPDLSSARPSTKTPVLSSLHLPHPPARHWVLDEFHDDCLSVASRGVLVVPQQLAVHVWRSHAGTDIQREIAVTKSAIHHRAEYFKIIVHPRDLSGRISAINSKTSVQMLSLNPSFHRIIAASAHRFAQTTSVILGDLFRADLTKGPPFTFDKITLPAVNFSATTKTLRGRQGHGVAMALNFIRFLQVIPKYVCPIFHIPLVFLVCIMPSYRFSLLIVSRLFLPVATSQTANTPRRFRFSVSALAS